MRWLDLVVPGDPVAWQRAGRSRRGQSFTPARTKNAEAALAWEFKRAVRRATSLPCAVTVEFRRATYRRCDIDNLLKLVLDSGNGVVWLDDSQIVEVHMTVVRGCADPCTRIVVDTVHVPR